MFPGGSMVMGPKGDLRVRGPLWEEAIVTAHLDLEDVTRARADAPMVADLEVMMPHLVTNIQRIDARIPAVVEYDGPDCGPTEGGYGISDVGFGSAKRSASDTISPSGSPISAVRVVSAGPFVPPLPLDIDAKLTEEWLVHFIRHEMARRGFERALIGISGGVDSAVTAYLAARALGPRNVIGVRMPYRTSSRDSLEHAQTVIDALRIEACTVDISDAVDGYLRNDPNAESGRRGNVMARMRMIVLFDLSAKHRAIPLGTGNKTERLFGYFTWHADDAPPINPLGDLFKTQVWELARHLGVPDSIVSKPPTADLVVGQTDEGDFGISYLKADSILNWMLAGYKPDELIARGFDESEVQLVRKRLDSTHWKRRLPTVAMLSPTAIGESYLRPVDY
jgi:NAD+ synthetase